MKIGEKLRDLRTKAGITQETVAESIGITRQTLSSWENDRSLPDAYGIAALSDLYGVTVESILQEDIQMKQGVKDHQAMLTHRLYLYKGGQIGLFALAWSATVVAFWLGGNDVHVLVSLLAIYALIPILTVVFGAILGADELWKWGKWLFVLIGGAANALWYSMTYGLANVLSNDKSVKQWLEYTHEPERFWIGVALATVGIVIGLIMKQIKRAALKRLVAPSV